MTKPWNEPEMRCALDPATLRKLPKEAAFRDEPIATKDVERKVPAALRGDVSVVLPDGATSYPWRGVWVTALGLDGEPLSPMSASELEAMGWTDATLLDEARKEVGCPYTALGPLGPTVPRRWAFDCLMRAMYAR